MKLSDAIALGRTLAFPWERGRRGEDRKCALMLAGLAANGNSSDWLTNLPFLKAGFDGLKLATPCNCNGEGEWPCPSGNGSVPRVVMHMFNHHVAELGDWTLDRLIDWVRSVEPDESASEAAEELLEDIRQHSAATQASN